MTEPARKRPRPAPKPSPVAPANDEGSHEAPSTTAPDRPTEIARNVRRKRAQRLGLRLAVGVLLPTVASGAYYGLIDTRQFESVASFTIQSADGKGHAGIETLLSSVSSTASRDVRIVQSYIQSRDMLRLLSEKHGFVNHYSAQNIDYLSRLPPDASFEQRYEYYQDQVSAEYDSEAGVVTLRVRAFDPVAAEQITQAILSASERKVNRMMEQARADRIALATREVKKAEERLSDARNKVRKLQADRKEINPEASAEAALSLKTALEQELARKRAKLSAMRQSLQPNTPQLAAQRQRVAALERQVARQQERLASDGQRGLHADIAAFEPVLAEKKFAEKAYESALRSLELARLEADRQHRYLVTVASPSTPEEPTHPRVFLAVLAVFVVSFALMGIGSLIVASIREHAHV